MNYKEVMEKKFKETEKQIMLKQGFAYRGAEYHEISKEDAIGVLHRGNYARIDIDEEDDKRLYFSIYSASDMW